MSWPSCRQSVVVKAMLAIQLEAEQFEPLSALAEWHQLLAARLGIRPAAESHFVGRVRPSGANDAPLTALELEHYPGMTEACIASLAAAAAGQHGATAVLVIHRIGLVLPGDAIVLVAVAADRRGPAQRCCQELLEALKHEAPFWKREWSQGVGSWITGNTPL
ncbi:MULTISPECIES: molybdenum cofactor biosynthesis protein MoaE [Cyanobium]|nr:MULTISPECIES: molybdenum cofactor biosynthesis protein MoaE [Cyanobium]